ncbi:MAG: phage tail tube protein [bacterium]|nr:phage tail tube protein [bacterium]
MGYYSGYKSQVGFGFEPVPGQKPITLNPCRFDVKLPIGLKIERNMIEREIVRGSGSSMKKLLGLIKVSGGLNAELYTKQTLYWYRLLMGGLPTTTAPTDVLLLAATNITPTMSVSTQPTVASKIKMVVNGATGWGTITVTGTDGMGLSISETITFTTNEAQITTKYFLNIKITTTGFTGGTLTIYGNKNTYSHVFTLAQEVPTITVENSKGGMPWTYWGLGMKSMEIKIPQVEGVAEVSADFIGQNGEPKNIDGGTTPTVLNEFVDTPFMNWNMQFRIDDVIVGIHSCTLSIDRNIRDNTAEIKDGCQEALPRHVMDNQRKISGSFNVQFADATYYNKFINGTSAKITIYGTNQEASGPFESIKFDLPEIVFEGTDPDVGDMGEIWIDVPFTAFSSLGVDDELVITAVSTQSNCN